MEKYVDFSELEGCLIKDVIVNQNLACVDDSVEFICDNGKTYKLYHEQDCCESVVIESIDGDIYSFVGHTVVQAEESSNDNHDEPDLDWDAESMTWTFYRLSDSAGNYVVIRWTGSSNGYYSEGVSFVVEN